MKNIQVTSAHNSLQVCLKRYTLLWVSWKACMYLLQILIQLIVSPSYILVESWELGRQQTILKVVKIVKFKPTKADVIDLSNPPLFLSEKAENPTISISTEDGLFGRSQIDGNQVLVRTCKNLHACVSYICIARALVLYRGI